MWVAELMLVKPSAHAVLARDGDLALKHHVETITGSWGTMQQLWQRLDCLYGAWQACAFCANGSSSLVAT